MVDTDQQELGYHREESATPSQGESRASFDQNESRGSYDHDQAIVKKIIVLVLIKIIIQKLSPLASPHPKEEETKNKVMDLFIFEKVH